MIYVLVNVWFFPFWFWPHADVATYQTKQECEQARSVRHNYDTDFYICEERKK